MIFLSKILSLLLDYLTYHWFNIAKELSEIGSSD